MNMNMNKKTLLVVLMAILFSAGAWAKAERQTVVLDVDIHCQGCVNKIEKNIAFEKGVKDLVCDLEAKTVTVTFDPAKTDLQTLLEAFAKINKPAKVHAEGATDADVNEQPETDARTGATALQ